MKVLQNILHILLKLKYIYNKTVSKINNDQCLGSFYKFNKLLYILYMMIYFCIYRILFMMQVIKYLYDISSIDIYVNLMVHL